MLKNALTRVVAGGHNNNEDIIQENHVDLLRTTHSRIVAVQTSLERLFLARLFENLPDNVLTTADFYMFRLFLQNFFEKS